jgi:hypothetical protein
MVSKQRMLRIAKIIARKGKERNKGYGIKSRVTRENLGIMCGIL